MTKTAFAFTCILLTYSIAKAAKQQSNVDVNTKEVPMEAKKDMGRSMEETGGDNQEAMTVDVMAIMMQCNETFRIEMMYLEALNESGSFPDELDRTPKCYMRCLLEKTGVASQEGLYNPQMAAMIFGWERGKAMNLVEDMATACTLDRGETCKCERAYQYMKCFMEKQIQEYEKSMLQANK